MKNHESGYLPKEFFIDPETGRSSVAVVVGAGAARDDMALSAILSANIGCSLRRDTELDFAGWKAECDHNLILIGGPVSNIIVKQLEDEGISAIDWATSPGEWEYIEAPYGDCDILIIAGADRDAIQTAIKSFLDWTEEAPFNVNGFLEEAVAADIPLDKERANYILREIFYLERNLLGALNSVHEEELLQLVRDDQSELVSLLDELEIPLIPTVEEMTLVQISDIAHFDSSIVQAPPRDQKFYAFLDVLFHAAGLWGIDQSLRAGLGSLVKKLVRGIIGAIKRKDWGRLIGLLRDFLEEITGKAFARKMKAKLGKEATKKFLAAIGSKLIPFIGWGLFIAGLIIGLKRNWDALADC